MMVLTILAWLVKSLRKAEPKAVQDNVAKKLMKESKMAKRKSLPHCPW